jgi:hypothetical protein
LSGSKSCKFIGFGLAASLLMFLSGCSGLSRSEARSILLDSDPDLQKTVIVQIGFLNSHCGEPLTSAKYMLLQKAGVIQIQNASSTTEVMTTSKGDDLFKQFGAQRLEDEKFKLVTGQQSCNFRSWAVPIATRQMGEVKVTSTGADSADVTYNWKWKPNEIGTAFTAESPLYKSLSEHERQSLEDNDFPLDNSLPHATKQRFIHDASGWHLMK